MKLNQRSLHLFHLLPFLCHEVAANTEIINFSSSRERTVDLLLDVVGNWSKLHPSDNERRWSLEPAALHTPLHQVCEQINETVTPFACPHELWVLLDLDDEKWASYSTFTLRLSWPASTPADFAISDVHHTGSSRPTIRARPDLDLARARAHTRPFFPPHILNTTHPHHALQIRPYPCPPQPRVPIPIPHPGSDVPARVPVDEHGKTSVPFIIILEPLYLGVLPATLLPTVGFLIPIVLAAALSASLVIAYFEPFVRQARADLNTRMTGTRKKR
ncbi:hypothetical protein J3R82DRAFT_212 [Butyriboletus roseoflavus]|nr:hypothetical protein J3R82DRAFT_212 [Butyriboletus roseoflavus]